MLIGSEEPVSLLCPILVGVAIGWAYHYVKAIIRLIFFVISGKARMWKERLVNPDDPEFIRVVIFQRMICQLVDHTVGCIAEESKQLGEEVKVTDAIILTALSYELLRRFGQSRVVPSKVDLGDVSLIIVRRS